MTKISKLYEQAKNILVELLEREPTEDEIYEQIMTIIFQKEELCKKL